MTGDNDFDDEFVQEGLRIIKNKLGQGLYDQLQILSQEQIIFLLEVIHDLEGSHSFEEIREWFANPRSKLGDSTPAEIFSEHWTPEGLFPIKVKKLSASQNSI